MPVPPQVAEEIVRIAQTGEPQKGYKFRDLLFQHVVTYWSEATLDNLVYAFDTLRALWPVVETGDVFPEARQYGDPTFRRQFKGWILQHFDYKTGGVFHSRTAGWPSPYAALMALIAVMYLANPETGTLKRAQLTRRAFDDYLGVDFVEPLVQFIRRLENSTTGGFSEAPDGPVGSITTSTCCEILKHLDEPLKYPVKTASLLKSPWKIHQQKFFACANSVGEDPPGIVPVRYNLRVWLRHLRKTAQQPDAGRNLSDLLDENADGIVQFVKECQKDGGYALSPLEEPSVVPTAHVVALRRDLDDAIQDGYRPKWANDLIKITDHDPSSTLGFLLQQSKKGFFSWIKACEPNLYSLRAAARIWDALYQQKSRLTDAEKTRLDFLGLSMLSALQAFWQPESRLFTGYRSK